VGDVVAAAAGADVAGEDTLVLVAGSGGDLGGALGVDQQQAATELIAAGVIATYDDELMPSRRLEAAIDNFQLQQLR
jgi:hypothetical protein